jgi:long-chain acyl-CoA synthetase
MVSGGSALPLHIASFFDMAGLKIIAGYGLTETSPTLANNLVDRNVLGSVGRPPKGTEIRIVELESRKELSVGQSGVILVRGPGVMVGYNDNPRATAEVIGTDGFFDTGDLGRINPATGDLIMTGRAKDTIVLSNGENIEPQPIEDAMIGTSPLIDQAMIVGGMNMYMYVYMYVHMHMYLCTLADQAMIVGSF